jgi:hypothetical protein
MSYDLYFWKQSALSERPHAEVLERLNTGNPPEFVELLPALELVTALKAVFPTIVENHTTDPDCPVQLIYDPPDGGVLIIVWNSHVLCVESHGVKDQHLNRIIDVGLEFGCRLYDTQTDERYEA